MTIWPRHLPTPPMPLPPARRTLSLPCGNPRAAGLGPERAVCVCPSPQAPPRTPLHARGPADGLSPYEYTSSCSCACETYRYRGHGDDWAAAPRRPRHPPLCGGRRKARGRGWCRSSFPPNPTSSAGTLRRIRESRAGSSASQGAGVWRHVVSPPKAFHPISRRAPTFVQPRAPNLLPLTR
jgi:hypothetical protein